MAGSGLEFGTTGLHQPFHVLIKEGPILDRPNVHWLDAGETRTLRYGCFLLPAADGTAGVSNIALSGSELAVKPIRAANANGAPSLLAQHCIYKRAQATDGRVVAEGDDTLRIPLDSALFD